MKHNKNLSFFQSLEYFLRVVSIVNSNYDLLSTEGRKLINELMMVIRYANNQSNKSPLSRAYAHKACVI